MTSRKLPPIASLIFVFVGFLFTHEVKGQEYFGSFQGDLVVKALEDGRKLQLVNPYSFVDATGKLWAVPVGAVVDGASIPREFWTIMGGPFDDKYRDASVIHDHYCDQKTETWENVHLVFYNGMRAREVSSVKAKLMYAAVYAFGPRWVEVTPGRNEKLISGQPILLDDAKEKILRFISESDPTIADINRFSDQLAQIKNIEQLEALLYQNANCTPILNGGDEGLSPSRTLVLCGLSVASKKQAAIKNLRTMVEQLRKLVRTQRFYFLPLIDEYVESQDPEQWEKVKTWSSNVYGLIKLGMRSVLNVEDSQKLNTPSIDDVFGVLVARASMISPLLTGPPKSPSEMRNWALKYRELVFKLEKQLTELEKQLSTSTQ